MSNFKKTLFLFLTFSLSLCLFSFLLLSLAPSPAQARLGILDQAREEAQKKARQAARAFDAAQVKELKRLSWLEESYIYQETRPVSRRDFYASLRAYLTDEKTVTATRSIWDDHERKALALKARFQKIQDRQGGLSRIETARALAEIFYIEEEEKREDYIGRGPAGRRRGPEDRGPEDRGSEDKGLEEKAGQPYGQVPLAFTDLETLSDKDYHMLFFLQEADIMRGDEEGTFRPQALLNHREMVDIFYRLRYPVCPQGGRLILDQIIQRAPMDMASPKDLSDLEESLVVNKLCGLGSYPLACGRIRLVEPPRIISNSIGRPWLVLRGHYPRQKEAALRVALISDQGRQVDFLEAGEIFYDGWGVDTVLYELISDEAFMDLSHMRLSQPEAVVLYDPAFSSALYAPLASALP